MYNDQFVIVTMTSWKGRIDNVTKVLDTIADGTVLPDIVEINLSQEEFPNFEKDLPQELNDYSRLLTKIFWTGPNVKVFKKLIPTIRRHYNDIHSCVIITIDDDVIYEKDFLEKLLKASEENPDAIIANGFCHGFYRSQQCVNGAGTLYKPHFFNEFLWKGMIKQVVDTNEDDWWYSFNLWLFGTRQVKYVPTKLTFFNEVGGHQYNTAKTQAFLNGYHGWLMTDDNFNKIYNREY